MTTKLNTSVIHGGQKPDPHTGAVMPPISMSSTYAQQSPGVHTGFEYSRGENPTRFALEAALASIESGQHAYAFSSGLATASTIMELLQPGDHVVAMDDLYGGTFRLFDRIKQRSQGLSFTFVDIKDEDSLVNAIQANTKMIWVESPTNPLLKVVDLSMIARVAKQHNIITVADNTFATPILQRPLELGIDIVMHSTTKYLNGHSDIIGGCAIVGDNPSLAEQLKFFQYAIGAVPSPFDCYLALRGIKTLGIRMERHCHNARMLANWLGNHPLVKKIYFPGLESHPTHAIAKQQMSNFGGMISIDCDLDLAGTKRFLENLHVFTLAESLGGVESLIEHPAIMTHASLPPENRAALGINDGFVRLSVGIEAIEDLIADIEQGFKAV